ncbi:MAG: methionine gamma-lyase family protein, partial [Lachnospiraceae bacterium]|nr:methionine gamma-lyase family protein [Lachnospiraceae bacterium]
MYREYGIKDEIIEKVESCERELAPSFSLLEKIYEHNQLKVLKSFVDNKLSESHFQEATGYGYNDQGRDVIDDIYKDIFHTESAFVRASFASGTHTLSTALFALTKRGDKILSINGYPYDTLHKILGIHGEKGSLKDTGVDFDKIDLVDGGFDKEKIHYILEHDINIKLIMIQRSRGYEMRHSFSVSEIKDIVEYIRLIKKDVIIFVDNCYGEFTNMDEPSDVGADIVIGSLIKNIGGGIARSGGYVCGKK